MAAPKYNPPEAILAIWEGYVKKNKGSMRAAWQQAPAPKPSYKTFLLVMKRRMGLEKIPVQNGNPDVPKNGHSLALLPAQQEKVRLTDRALALIGGAGDLEPAEYKGYVRGVLALLGKAP